MQVPSVDDRHYVEQLSAGKRYSIYKVINTKLVRANFFTDGVITSGNKYDEYVDDPDYYVIKGTSGTPQKISLKKKALKNARKAILMTAGAAVQKFMQNLEKEQEVMMNISDMLIELFVCESVLLRTEKLISIKGEAACAMQIDMTKTYISDAMEKINLSGKHAITSFNDGDTLRIMLMGLKRFTKYEPYNTIAARRRVADKLIEENGYCF